MHTERCPVLNFDPDTRNRTGNEYEAISFEPTADCVQVPTRSEMMLTTEIGFMTAVQWLNTDIVSSTNKLCAAELTNNNGIFALYCSLVYVNITSLHSTLLPPADVVVSSPHRLVTIVRFIFAELLKKTHKRVHSSAASKITSIMCKVKGFTNC